MPGKSVNDVNLSRINVIILTTKESTFAVKLEQMKKFQKTNPPGPKPDNLEKETLQGYQFYPESEDIYIKFREEKNMDPEDISRLKKTVKSDNAPADIGEESNDEVFGGNLDVPGSELDDEQENVGNEDEENNYYSIGGDAHNNLDEDKDEL